MKILYIWQKILHCLTSHGSIDCNLPSFEINNLTTTSDKIKYWKQILKGDQLSPYK